MEMIMSNILYLDLGTQTGYAIRRDNAPVISGSISFKHGKYDGGGMRYYKFRKWLTETKIKLPNKHIEAVYFEAVRNHESIDSSHAYGGLMGTLAGWCEHYDIPYEGIAVGTIKKAVTGKGNASKEQVTDAVIKLGYNPVDDNEADALALLYMVENRPEGVEI